jgi:signal transduction histidine kinase
MATQAMSHQALLFPGVSLDERAAIPKRKPLCGLTKIVASISHDLRLPLTAILCNAEFLAESDLSNDERNEFYVEIRCAVDSMNEMLSLLLEFSKETDSFRPEIADIVGAVKRAIALVAVRKEFRRVSITHHHEGSSLGSYDPSRLQRVIANLVLNACEAVSSESGRIVITTSVNNTCIQISVWDNGPGVPVAIQHSLFQPFVSYGKADGSGLGLAIAKQLVEDHHGEIFLDQRCRSGTLFNVTIPAVH